MKIALAELGTMEVPGIENNKRILEYHKAAGVHNLSDAVPWCGSYVSFCMKSIGQILPNSPWVSRMWMGWGVGITQPSFGCVVVLKRGKTEWTGHVGFLMDENKDDFVLVSGNVNNAVRISKFPKSDLLGMRWI